MKIHKNTVAVIADLHLGLHQANKTWHDICLDYAEWLKTDLHNRGIQDILILGDIIDNRNEVAVTTLHILYKFFKVLEDFNIIAITGNHDCYYNKRTDVHSLGTLNDWSNMEIIDTPVTINQFGKTLTFCPWSTEMVDIPKSDIMLGHFEINTFKMNGGHICSNGYNAQELLDKAPLVLSGHFHGTEERDYKKGKVIYIGSPYQQSWGEAGDAKGYFVLDLHDDTMEFIPNEFSPRHIRINLSEILAVGKITPTIKKEFEGNIISLVIDTEIDQSTVDALVSKIHALKPISVKPDNQYISRNIISTDTDISFDGIDIKGDMTVFVNEFEEVENKDELINYLSEAYDFCMEKK